MPPVTVLYNGEAWYVVAASGTRYAIAKPGRAVRWVDAEDCK